MKNDCQVKNAYLHITAKAIKLSTWNTKAQSRKGGKEGGFPEKIEDSNKGKVGEYTCACSAGI